MKYIVAVRVDDRAEIFEFPTAMQRAAFIAALGGFVEYATAEIDDTAEAADAPS